MMLHETLIPRGYFAGSLLMLDSSRRLDLLRMLRFSFPTIANLLVCLLIVSGCQNAPETADQPQPAPPAPALEAQRAAAGVGKQGEKLLGHNEAQRIISGPASELFQLRQRAVFDIQIPQALNLFKATNGRAPRNHEEFVKQVLEPNGIVLPELRAGMAYQFNPEREELWVYPESEVPQGN
jgi:hypothetical protein